MHDLQECWRIRNAAATTLASCEQQMRHAVQAASIEQLVGLLETFAPARSAGPDWTRSFEPLVERLRAWRDRDTLTTLAEIFRARGMPWIAAANALTAEPGAGDRTERHAGFASA